MTANTEGPQRFWHYTDAAGLLGILRSSKLWATYYAHQNDTRELIFGYETFKRHMWTQTQNYWNRFNQNISPGSRRSTVRDYPERIRDLFLELDKQFDSEHEGDRSLTNLFTASFCVDGDLLSQWRGYGGGFAVEFDTSGPGFSRPKPRHPDAATLNDANAKPLRVGYYEIDGSSNLGNSAASDERNEEDFLRMKGMNAEDTHYSLSLILIRSLLIKHSGFCEENEYRIFIEDPKNSQAVKFRNIGNQLVKYVELGFTPEMITSVRCGPGARGVREVQDLLKSLGYPVGQIEVTQSQTPYQA